MVLQPAERQRAEPQLAELRLVALQRVERRRVAPRLAERQLVVLRLAEQQPVEQLPAARRLAERRQVVQGREQEPAEPEQALEPAESNVMTNAQADFSLKFAIPARSLLTIAQTVRLSAAVLQILVPYFR